MNAARRVNRQLREQGSVHLAEVSGVAITLENGRTVTLKPADELSVSADPLELREEALRAPAQLAFWAYQTERASTQVRQTERDLAHREGFASLTYRQWYNDQKATYTEDMIRSRVSIDAEVDKLRNQLLTHKQLYGVLRAMRDSVEHRAYVLRRLTSPDGTTAQRGCSSQS